jgi:inosine/xanthosine triphosphate pyrophosphatase family protein
MPLTLLFATLNPYKGRLFVPIFADRGIRCLTLCDIGVQRHDLIETGDTPEENALIKARAYWGAAWPLVFGDDAALEIDALDGEPGVKARRWGGRFDDDVDDETWLAYMLQRMEGVPLSERTARYVSAWAVITPDGKEHVRRIIHEFTVAERPLRPIPPGAPMSAVELNQGDHLAHRHPQLAAEWAAWGLLERIAERGAEQPESRKEG